METISKWLLQDDQKDLFEILFAITLNIIFLGLISLLLRALDKLSLAFLLAKGYGILWLVLFGTTILLNQIYGLFRINLHDHGNAFVLSNLMVCCFLQIGWSAFAVITVQGFLANPPAWIVGILYVVAFLSCLIAFFAVSSFYQGHVYKFISLPIALICFLVFSLWPLSGPFLFGWIFDLF